MNKFTKYFAAAGLLISAALPFTWEKLPDKMITNKDGSVVEYFINGGVVDFDFTGKTAAGTTFYGNRLKNGEVDIFDLEGTYKTRLSDSYCIVLGYDEILGLKNGQIFDENYKTKSRSPSQITSGGSVVDTTPPEISWFSETGMQSYTFATTEKKLKRIKVFVDGEEQTAEHLFNPSNLLSARNPFCVYRTSPQETIETMGASDIHPRDCKEFRIEVTDFAGNKIVLTKKLE